MILDRFENLPRYNLPYKDKIVQFLESRDPKSVPDGEHEIDGRNLFVRVMTDTLKPAGENKFEAHRIYADLQYVVQGVELMQVTLDDMLPSVTAYDAKGDVQFFKTEEFITDFVVRAGEFTIFYPGEVHRPSCVYPQAYTGYKGPHKKLVFKIKI